MIDVPVSVAEPVVSRANNRLRLELIDADISPSLKAMVDSEDRAKDLSSKIVCAGVQMLAIQRDDPDAWLAFKNADSKAKEITCKGDGAPFREVAAVLWREYRATPSRERISMYGKAIRIAHDAYYETVTTSPDELLTHIVNARKRIDRDCQGFERNHQTKKDHAGSARHLDRDHNETRRYLRACTCRDRPPPADRDG